MLLQDAITLLLLDIFLCKWLTTKKSDIFDETFIHYISTFILFYF